METKTTPSYSEELKGLVAQLGEMLPANALETFNKDAKQLADNHSTPLKLSGGDKAPMFSLSNAVGEAVNLADLLKRSSVVLAFYRGTWCPYCNLQLNQYQQILPEIERLGANLVAISPQTPDESLNMKEKNELKFEVLSDNGNIVAKQFTTVFRNADEPINTMANLGIDFDSYYGDDSREIPVPAVFVINQEGIITFAQSAGGDYRNRVEPKEILHALK